MEPTLNFLTGTTDGGGGGGPGGTTLGLSNKLNSSSASRMRKDDQNSAYTNEAEVELGLGLSLNTSKSKGPGGHAWSHHHEYGRILTAKDFPNGFPRSNVNVGSASSNGTVSQVVGWPPIGVHRMSSLVNQAKTANVDDEGRRVVGNDQTKDMNSNKKTNHGNNKDDGTQDRGHLGFVKVNVDGLTIGRKVDLNAHSCYESLAKTLEEMFFKSTTTGGENDLSKQPSKLLDGSSEFELTYEDKEGDWMLVGDVPWGMFLTTVKRLRIMKTSETNMSRQE